MNEEKRSYRKSLSSHGLIYLAGRELNISVKNLSITGLLAELDANAFITEVDGIFNALTSSVTIDLYLPEMRLAGESDIVRAEKIEGHIYFALEFRNLTYDVNNLLYQRRAYRKCISVPGEIIFEDKSYSFLTQNVSIDGLMIHLNKKIVIEEGYITTFNFQELELEGEVKVVWVEDEDNGSTLIGLQYVSLIQQHMNGIPRFIFDQD